MAATDRSEGPLDEVDLTDASVCERAAPHPWLNRLRPDDPVHRHPEADGPGFRAVTRHDDVRRTSAAPELPSSRAGGPRRLDPPPEDFEQVRMVIIAMDPPEHRTFRTPVSKAFTPKMISRIEPA